MKRNLMAAAAMVLLAIAYCMVVLWMCAPSAPCGGGGGEANLAMMEHANFEEPFFTKVFHWLGF